MKTLFSFFFLFLFSFLQAEEKPFVIVITGGNDAIWYKQNLDAIFHQNYDNYRIVYIANAPSDNTLELVQSYLKENQHAEKVTFFINKTKTSHLACLAKAAFAAKPEEIVIDMYGRDWFAHNDVLRKFNDLYQNSNIWMTYGQYLYYPFYLRGFVKQLPDHVIENNTFRTTSGLSTLPRTFYAGLFQQIKKEDLLFEGVFIPFATDLAYCIPMIEMAGPHAQFSSDVAYIFNYEEPLSEDRIDHPLEATICQHLMNKPPYERIVHWHPKTLSIYERIDTIAHPSLSDYRFIQEFLFHGKREILSRLQDSEPGVRQLKLIGKAPDEYPIKGQVAINCNAADKENCILLYASFNRNYVGGLKRLLNLIRQSDYKGHVLYQLGGWPNAEEGDLCLAHVPYAFKVSFFKEAEKKGYKRVLWLDTAVIPVVSLNTIFGQIEQKGYFVMGNTTFIGPYMHPFAAAYFGYSLSETENIPSCSAGLFGVDFTKKIGRDLVEDWYRAAHDADAFYSARSDQNALSMILYQRNISDFESISKLPHAEIGETVQEDSLFFLDRLFTH